MNIKKIEMKKEFKNEVNDYFKSLNKNVKNVSLSNGYGGYYEYVMSWKLNNDCYRIEVYKDLSCGGKCFRYEDMLKSFNDEDELNILCNMLKEFYIKYKDL